MGTLLSGGITNDVFGKTQRKSLLRWLAKEIGCTGGNIVRTTDALLQFQRINSVTDGPIVEYTLSLVSCSFLGLFPSELLLVLRSDRHAIDSIGRAAVLIQLSLDLSELHDVLNYVDLVHVLLSTRCHDALSASQLKAEAVAALGEVVVDELAERGSLVQRLEPFAFEAIMCHIATYWFMFGYRLLR